MPQSADEESQQNGSHHAFLFGFSPCKGHWKKDVVIHPGIEANVPAIPKLGHALGEEWGFEVAHQFDSKQLGCSNGDVGVPREVSVDLECEEYEPKKEGDRMMLCRSIEAHVDVGRTGVGDDDLLEHAPEDETHAVAPLLVSKGAGRGDLRQEVGGALDGPRDKLGKERDECGKCDGVAGGLEVAPIDVDGVGEGLEGVEGDADGQDDLQGGGVHGDAEAVPGGDPVLDEEVGVLEVAKDAKVDGERNPETTLLALPVIGLFDADADEVVDEGGEGDEPEEAPVPPAIEDV